MMLHPSTRGLIEKLYNLTVERRIVWMENSRGNGVYAVGSYAVEVSADPCEFRICGAGGNELEVAGLTELTTMQTPDGRSYDRIVREMAIDSVRIASGLEQAISSLTENLDQPGIEAEAIGSDGALHQSRRIVDFAGATQKRSLLRRRQVDEQAAVVQATQETSSPVDCSPESGRDYSTWT